MRYELSIRGAGLSVVTLLRRMYVERHGDDGLRFELISTRQFSVEPSNAVTLFLYRVDVDPTQRHHMRQSADPREAGRRSMRVELRYLLTIWGNDAQREHQVLERVMAILEEHAIISGELLDPTDPWEPDETLQVILDQLDNEELLRLWDSLSADFRLSVPYCVRTIRVGSALRDPLRSPPVDARVNVLGPTDVR